MATGLDEPVVRLVDAALAVQGQDFRTVIGVTTPVGQSGTEAEKRDSRTAFTESRQLMRERTLELGNPGMDFGQEPARTMGPRS